MSNPLTLIIEDNAVLAEMFSQTLQREMFETEICKDGPTALERLASLVPDIVLLDLNLPKVSGAEVLRQIRADERLKETLVVIVSADKEVAIRLQADADLVLIKPISLKKLRQKVTELYASHKGSQNCKPV